jgi:two-component system secretion system sensor histidine kinase SalK
MSKAERPEVQTLIRETLDKLNRTVREEMQDYHSVMLKNLTLKENYDNLLSELAQKFDVRHAEVIFECADDLFLAMPYHLVLSRAIRELVTNAYKHANCTKIHVTLTQINDSIDLTATDNGNAWEKDLQNAMELRKGKGLLSLQEMITSLGGQFTVSDAKPQGICVRVSLPMKGDGSYQYFAHR